MLKAFAKKNAFAIKGAICQLGAEIPDAERGTWAAGTVAVPRRPRKPWRLDQTDHYASQRPEENGWGRNGRATYDRTHAEL
jgi:hypothetical protein